MFHVGERVSMVPTDVSVVLTAAGWAERGPIDFTTQPIANLGRPLARLILAM
jgi:hypothetical protein